MYDSARLIQQFSGLVGFTQPYDPSYGMVPEALTASSSGRYIQTTHPLCTLETIYNCAPEFAKFSYPNWQDTNYSKSSLVKNVSKIWRASANIATGYPEPGQAGSDNWVEVNPFAMWLQDIYNSSILEMVADLIRLKKLDHSNRTLVDSLRLFDGLGSLNDRIVAKDRFVGFEINISKQEGLQVRIDKVGLQVDGVLAVLPIYLFHSSATEPLKTFNIASTTGSSFSWQAVQDCILKYYEDSHDTDGCFYLGYSEKDLGVVQAIKRLSSWGKEPCHGCNGWNHMSWSVWSQHFIVNAFSVDQQHFDYDEKTLFDTSKMVYQNDTNWGLNLSVVIGCDLTEFFVSNKSLFSDCLAMKICVKLLAAIGYTTRMNFINDKTKALAIADLSEKDKDSFLNRYLNELQAVSVDFSGMSSDCLPCVKKKGINMGAA